MQHGIEHKKKKTARRKLEMQAFTVTKLYESYGYNNPLIWIGILIQLSTIEIDRCKLKILTNIIILKIRLYFEVPMASLCHHFVPSKLTSKTFTQWQKQQKQAGTVMSRRQEKYNKNIYFPIRNKSAVWIYFGFFRQKTGQQAKLMLYANIAVTRLNTKESGSLRSSLTCCFRNISCSVSTMLY